jgi:hypothetical protein
VTTTRGRGSAAAAVHAWLRSCMAAAVRPCPPGRRRHSLTRPAWLPLSPLRSLYHSLHSVYAPMLGVQQGGGAGQQAAAPAAQQLDGRLQELLISLEAGLGAAMRKMPDQVGAGPNPGGWGARNVWRC